MKVLLLLSAIGAVFVLLTADVVAQSGSGQRSKTLTLRGTVESVQVKEIDHSSALIEIKVKMELVNVGERPVIPFAERTIVSRWSYSKEARRL